MDVCVAAGNGLEQGFRIYGCRCRSLKWSGGGFQKDGFYIVKPNEKRLWHKAIAHLDLNEFTDVILTAGKKHRFNVR